MVLRLMLQHWDIDDVEYPWVASILILALLLRYLLVLAFTNGSKPIGDSLFLGPFSACDAPPRQFPRICQTDNTLQIRHD